MKILLLNDDGIDSPGLWELQRSLSHLAEIVVVAPATEQSGKGAGISLPQPLYAKKRTSAPCEAWSVEGTPADCVKIALKKLLLSPPNLIISGINPGSNAGTVVFYSGTVGGVIAGVLEGIPGIAFSSASGTDPQFSRFSPYIASIVHYATISHPIPEGTLLNVTFPYQKILDTYHQGEIAGIKFTRQGKSFSLLPKEEDTDTYWLEHGYITIVPVYVGELTHGGYLQKAREIPTPHMPSWFSQKRQFSQSLLPDTSLKTPQPREYQELFSTPAPTVGLTEET
jgi:5'-nucleotidase